MGYPLPVTPGHGSTSELLAALVNPSSNISMTNYSISGTSFTVPALPSRRTLIVSVQSSGIIWLQISTPAAINTGLKLPEGAMFGMDLADSKDVNLIAASGTTNVCVLQIGA